MFSSLFTISNHKKKMKNKKIVFFCFSLSSIREIKSANNRIQHALCLTTNSHFRSRHTLIRIHSYKWMMRAGLAHRYSYTIEHECTRSRAVTQQRKTYAVVESDKCENHSGSMNISNDELHVDDDSPLLPTNQKKKKIKCTILTRNRCG